ncbi:MAG: hypothetical protein OXI39_00420 [Gemmatimonadota bacterium]|uniref:hypothetical protein n=1 Tax=Candidatus Palauibacter scopulicola TaxID=3056741 RepID=UPI0023A0AA1F|nr:hypothetical protein [Candidatus Palauibacter scopulicola]MDE2661456.1 hypothetical protein [Candidatus Palauibacter scopulicola]
MTIHRSSSVSSTSGRALFGLFAAMCLGLFMPDSAKAQCAGCAGDYQEDTVECASLPVGSAFCASGQYYDHKKKKWFSWCFSGGPECEWIMQLDFSEDGTAYAQRESLDPAKEQSTGSGMTGASSETCDGVPVGLRLANGDVAPRHAPLNIEL